MSKAVDPYLFVGGRGSVCQVVADHMCATVLQSAGELWWALQAPPSLSHSLTGNRPTDVGRSPIPIPIALAAPAAFCEWVGNYKGSSRPVNTWHAGTLHVAHDRPTQN